MSFSFGAETRDSLSNLAASLGAGKDKAAGDAFFVYDLSRAQVEAMYRGDWLARKVVDIVPYDMVREWRAWSGHAADVARAEAAERRLGLRKAVQRALVLGRLYGGGAIIIGTGERDPAALACPLEEDWLRPGGLKFLHVVSRWQLGVGALSSDPLSPWCGEPAMYELAAAGRAPLMLHPSRVVRFLGNPLPDPWAVATPWSDSVLQALYDAVHAAALAVAGATSLMHEAKVDVVTVPNLSEHLSSAETTDQLSARFAYAAAMKSINNLLLLGDGETWSRQSVDLGGLPEMVRCFLQVAAGAADIPVTRLLGQSPSGLSATGESDTRNYYDMIAARQELDLRPQLEWLDRLMLRSEGLDPAALSFAFRPLWQLDAASAAAIALQKAQATQIYAGLELWPAAVTARLVEAQLVEDGTYPNAAAVFAEAGAATTSGATQAFDYDRSERRDLRGRWSRSGAGTASAASASTSGGGGTGHGEPGGLARLLNLLNPVGTAQAQEIPPDEPPSQRRTEPSEADELESEDVIRLQRYNDVRKDLKEIDPQNSALEVLRAPGAVPSEAEVESLKTALFRAKIKAWRVAESKSERFSPFYTQRAYQQSALGQYYGNPNSPGSSYSEQFPEIEANPSGIKIEVEGKTAAERGDSYERGIVSRFRLDQPDEIWLKRRLRPDAVVPDAAIEVKYTDDFSRSMYNGYRGTSFLDKEIDASVEQALKYADGYPPTSLIYYTNDWVLAEFYTRAFRAVGLSNFRFIIVPATRKTQ